MQYNESLHSILVNYNVTMPVLKTLSLYQLRVLASCVGIKYIEKCKRLEIEQAIIDFKNAPVNPNAKSTKRAINDAEQTFEYLKRLARDYNDKNDIEYDPYSVSLFDINPFDFMDIVELKEKDNWVDEKELKGLVKFYGNIAYVKTDKYSINQEDPVIPIPIIANARILEGDLVTVKYIKNFDGANLVTKVIAINGQSPKEATMVKRFENIDIVKPFERIRLYDEDAKSCYKIVDTITEFKKGQRLLFGVPENLNFITKISKMSRYFHNSSSHSSVFLVNTKYRFDEFEEYCEKRDIVGINLQEVEPETARDIIYLMAQRAKRLYESGVDVLFIFDNFADIIDISNIVCDKCGSNYCKGIDRNAFNEPKDLFALARRAKGQEGSISMIIMSDTKKEITTRDAIFHYIENFCDSVVYFDDTLMEVNVIPPINLLKSGAKELNSEIKEKLKNWRKRIRGGHFVIETQKAVDEISKESGKE